MKPIKTLFITLLISSLFISCGNGISKRLTMGIVSGWAEGEAMTAIAKNYLEQKGYHVVIQKAAINLLLASMNNGDTDIYMDVWLPRTHGKKVARFSKIQSLGVVFDSARQGLTVPDYVTINSIAELNQTKQKFGGKIIGIERGAGITQYTDSAISTYQLDYEQMNSSTVAMAAELSRAIQQKKWIVITGWQPHWLFGRYKLKFLEDPKNVYGENERIEAYARQGLEKDFPEVANFIRNAKFTPEQLSALLLEINKTHNPDKVAKQWIQQNKSLVDRWWNS